jgi:glutaredoxin
MAWKIVSKPDCKWCSRAKAHLAVRGIEFEEEHLVTRDEQLAFKAATGLDTFPQVYEDGVLVGGFDALKKHLA